MSWQKPPDQRSRCGRGGSDRASLYDEISDRIIAKLEEGRVLWVQPWGTAAAKASLALPMHSSNKTADGRQERLDQDGDPKATSLDQVHQLMTAAISTAAAKLIASLSQRVATRRQSLSLHKAGLIRFLLQQASAS